MTRRRNDASGGALFASVPNVSVRYAPKGALRRELAAFEAGGRRDRDWLSSREWAAWQSLSDASRRDDWRLGRWSLKRLMVERLSADDRTRSARNDPVASMANVEILPRRIDGLSSRPVLVIDGIAAAAQVSLSHSDGGVLVAVGHHRGIAVGVDLIHPARVGQGFQRLWFTERERAWLDKRPPLILLAWAIKEASYKALQRGERFIPTALEVDFDRARGWHCCDRRTSATAEVEVCPLAGGCWAVLAYRSIHPLYPCSFLDDACRDEVFS